MLEVLFKNFTLRNRDVTDIPPKKRQLPPGNLAPPALIIIFLLIHVGCKITKQQEQKVAPGTISTKQLIVDHLSKMYEQPMGNTWEEGKTYFIPRKPGIELLQVVQPETGHRNLEVYKADVWFLHWGPEKFSILVWVVGSEDQSQLGVLEGPEEVVSELPIALKSLHFKSPETQENLALLVGKMIAVFYNEKSPVSLSMALEENCQWAEQSVARSGASRRVAASCFSEDGTFKKVILAPRSTT